MKKRIVIALLCVLCVDIIYNYHRSQNDSPDEGLQGRIFYGEVVGYESRENEELLVINDSGVIEYRFIMDENVIYDTPGLEESISNHETGFSVRVFSEHRPSECEKELIFPATTIELN